MDLHRKRERRTSVEKDIEHRAGIDPGTDAWDRPAAASAPYGLGGHTGPAALGGFSGSLRGTENSRPVKQARAQPARDDPDSDSSSSGAEGDREAWVNALYRRTRAREKHSAAEEGSKAASPDAPTPQSRTAAPGASRGSSGEEEEKERGPAGGRRAAPSGDKRLKKQNRRAKEAGWAVLGRLSSSSSEEDADRTCGGRRGGANGAERLQVPLYQDVPLRALHGSGSSAGNSGSGRTSQRGSVPPLAEAGRSGQSRLEEAASPRRTRRAGSPQDEDFGVGSRGSFGRRGSTEPGPGLAGAGGGGFLGSRESRERRREGQPREVAEEGILDSMRSSRLLRAQGEDTREPSFLSASAPSVSGALSRPSCPLSPQHFLTPR